MDSDSYQAVIRFGLGRRGTEAMPAAPADWLNGQLGAADPASFVGLPSTADGLRALAADIADNKNGVAGPNRMAALHQKDVAAQVDLLLTTAAPFRERLVLFWANHFSLSTNQGIIAPLIGPFVREVIRPHVTGKFSDMLAAAMRHPALLRYLENVVSMGPNSPGGKAMGRGMNENLARECLELYTLGTAGGYTQTDVTAFAAVLTGWSVESEKDPFGFVFRPTWHEPGPKTVLGRSYPAGQAGGDQLLAWLATQSATYTHLATKLATHFVSDQPPAAAVGAIAAALRSSGGDLGAAARAIIGLPQAWTPLTKLRAPLDYTVALYRALDLPAWLRIDMYSLTSALGQTVWNAPLPNGWPDTASVWAAPESLLRRVDVAYTLAARSFADPTTLADDVLGPLATDATLAAVKAQAAHRAGLAVLFSSPEFQRR